MRMFFIGLYYVHMGRCWMILFLRWLQFWGGVLIVIMPGYISCEEHGRAWVIAAPCCFIVVYWHLHHTSCFTKYVQEFTGAFCRMAC